MPLRDWFARLLHADEGAEIDGGRESLAQTVATEAQQEFDATALRDLDATSRAAPFTTRPLVGFERVRDAVSVEPMAPPVPDDGVALAVANLQGVSRLELYRESRTLPQPIREVGSETPIEYIPGREEGTLRLDGVEVNREALERVLAVPEPDVPLVGLWAALKMSPLALGCWISGASSTITGEPGGNSRRTPVTTARPAAMSSAMASRRRKISSSSAARMLSALWRSMSARVRGVIGWTVQETVGVGVINPAAARRVTVPEFEIVDNPTVHIEDFKARRFDILERTFEEGMWVCLRIDPDERPMQIIRIEGDVLFVQGFDYGAFVLTGLIHPVPKQDVHGVRAPVPDIWHRLLHDDDLL